LHTRPELAVAQALEQGVSPSVAFGEWQEAAQVLLDVLRANRSQCVMLEINSVLSAPEKLLEWLKNNRPSLLPLPSDAHRFTSESKSSGSPPSERNLLLATQLVAQSPNVQSLLAPLEASTVPLVQRQHAVPTVDIEKLTQQWQEEQQERESLKQALEQTRSQLEAVQNGHGNQTGTAEQAERARLEQQNKEVLSQMFKVQEELEKYHLLTKELKEQLRVANRDLGQAHKKLAAMETSLFWRITAPVRLGLGTLYKLLRKTKRFLAR
jgi:hypothetical protein